MVGSPEPFNRLYYDKEKMEFTEAALDNRPIKPVVTYSQTHYKSDSGKEKVLCRIQNKVIPNEKDLMKHLSTSFDLIIAIDTNTKVIAGETISATGIVHCVLQSMPEPDGYYAHFPWNGGALFRNCPLELPSEKLGWMTEIQKVNNNPQNTLKRFVMITDHDLGKHTLYNDKRIPIFRDLYLANNFTLMYGRGDGPTQNLLNYLIKQCDKKSTDVLRTIEQNGYFQIGDRKMAINQIPVPSL